MIYPFISKFLASKSITFFLVVALAIAIPSGYLWLNTKLSQLKEAEAKVATQQERLKGYDASVRALVKELEDNHDTSTEVAKLSARQSEQAQEVAQRVQQTNDSPLPDPLVVLMCQQGQFTAATAATVCGEGSRTLSQAEGNRRNAKRNF